MRWFANCCYRGGPLHHFEPRYTEAPRGMSCKVEGYMTADAMHRLTTLQIYVHDVCVWCGKIASLPKEAMPAKDPSDPVRAPDPKDPSPAQNPSDSPA